MPEVRLYAKNIKTYNLYKNMKTAFSAAYCTEKEAFCMVSLCRMAVFMGNGINIRHRLFHAGEKAWQARFAPSAEKSCLKCDIKKERSGRQGWKAIKKASHKEKF